MTADQIVKQVMAERNVGAADFFNAKMRRHLRSRLIAIDRLREAGFTKTEIGKALRKQHTYTDFWLDGPRSTTTPHWRKLIERGHPAGSDSIVLQVCHDMNVYRAEFFGRGRDKRLVEARREAIRRFQAADFDRASIARMMKRSQSTIHYWTNEKLREKKRQRLREYVVKWEARA